MQEPLHKTVNRVESPEDTALLKEFLAGSDRGFAALYERFYPAVFVFACRYVTEAEAEDACAECFLKLWQSSKDFNSIRGLWVYVRIMVRNECISMQRKKVTLAKREAEFSYVYDQDPAGNPWDEAQAHLHAAIARLPAQARKIIQLSILKEWKSKRISSSMGLANSTVRSQRTRAIKLLRKMLSDFREE